MELSVILGLINQLASLGETALITSVLTKHQKNIYRLETDISEERSLGPERDDRKLEGMYKQLRIERKALRTQLELGLSEALKRKNK